MVKRNPYLQHTYESFDQPVTARRHREDSFSEKVMGSGIAARFRSPLFATAALLIAGAAFAGIIIASYPSSDEPADNLPVITADASPLRESPTEPGGMDVPHQDSTVFGSIRSEGLEETPPIENLLAEEQPVDTAAMAPAEDGTVVAAVEPSAAALEPAPQAAKVVADAGETPPPSEMADATSATENKIPDIKVGETRSIPMKSETIPLASAAEKPAIAPAASSPETLAYVRSVLEKKDAGKSVQTAAAEPSAEDLAAIEPTAGAASDAVSSIEPGSSYVQLASISSESAAPKEWTKLQKSFPSLSGTEYRVQRADLGAKGVFFRIQAGPMSKDSAKSVCASIKQQKPGGCLIVQ